MKGIAAFVKHLKKEAPKDHILAYISNDEAKLLKSRGGSGKPYKYGILSFFASSPGDTGGAGGADGAGGNDAGGGSGDTGPGGSPTAVGPSHTGESIGSFGGNLSANVAANPGLTALSPIGMGLRTAQQTAQARSMLGLSTPNLSQQQENAGQNKNQPYQAVTPSSTASSSLGTAPKQNFFNLGIMPLLLSK